MKQAAVGIVMLLIGVAFVALLVSERADAAAAIRTLFGGLTGLTRNAALS